MPAKPFLKPAIEEVKLELSGKTTREIADMFSKMMSSRGPISAASFGPISRAYATGGYVTPRSMAHPAEPWPYGMVLRRRFAWGIDGTRVMALGNGTGMPLAGFAHTDYVPIPALHDWEPVPEDEP